jgi:hypothetical protein
MVTLRWHLRVRDAERDKALIMLFLTGTFGRVLMDVVKELEEPELVLGPGETITGTEKIIAHIETL